MLKILNLADIHWRGLSRHEEYTNTFKKLFKIAKEEKPDLIVIGGDIFHTKTSGISPEVIDKIAWMFKEFASIGKTYITLGNHDGNLSNQDRQDAISPIIEAIGNENLVLFKNSGSYLLDLEKGKVNKPVYLHVYSCFDKPGWNTISIDQSAINIAAFHGSVGGTEMDNGWKMPDFKAEVELKMFDGHDFVLLGDIHKRQFLAQKADVYGNMKPYVGYPGSTIQQNFGEEISKGFLMWEIKDKNDWDVRFIEVTNSQAFLNVDWSGDSKVTTNNLLKNAGNLKDSRVRINSNVHLSPSQQRELVSLFKETHGVSEVVFKSQKNVNYDRIELGNIDAKKDNLRNDKETIWNLYKQFIESNKEKYVFTNSDLEIAEQNIKDFMNTIVLDSSEETSRNVFWSIKDFSFNNLFCYGEGNKIDFQSLGGLVGISGKNKTGKSSIVGALLYTLFNVSDRSGMSKNGEIMNQNKKECSGSVVISIDNQDYKIERSSTRVEPSKKSKSQDAEKTETKLNFCKLNPDGTEGESLNGISREETDKNIRKLLGNAQDFLMTSISAQRQMERFVSEGPTARKSILNRFLDLDVFESLHETAKEYVKSFGGKSSISSNKIDWSKAFSDIQQEIISNQTILSKSELEIKETRNKIEEFREWLVLNNPPNVTESTEKQIKTQQELYSLKKSLEKQNAEEVKSKEIINGIKERIPKIEAYLAKIDIEKTKTELKSLRDLQEKSSELKQRFKLEETSLLAQEKSVKKLNVVPCGDSFPDCLYIKDSHEDKKTIEKQRKIVEETSVALANIMKELNFMQEKKFSEQLETFEKGTNVLKDLKLQLENEEYKLKSAVSSIVELKIRMGQTQNRLVELENSLSEVDSQEIEKCKSELKEAEIHLFSLERTKSNALVQIGKSQEKLENLKIQKESQEEITRKILIADSIQTAFGKNGIPANILRTQLPAVNEQLNKLLGNIVDFEILFDTEATSASQMEIYIKDAKCRRKLESASGMELMIASIAIRVALINLSILPKSDIFLVDEGLNALDDEHVPKCLELLQSLRDYFKTVFVITHMPQVKEATDMLVEVVSNGIESTIES